jgi:hypothetical protein
MLGELRPLSSHRHTKHGSNKTDVTLCDSMAQDRPG